VRSAVAACRSDSGIVAILETSKESEYTAYCGGSVGGSVRCFGGALSAARDDGGGDRGGHHILTSVSWVLCVPVAGFLAVSCNAERTTLVPGCRFRVIRWPIAHRPYLYPPAGFQGRLSAYVLFMYPVTRKSPQGLDFGFLGAI